MHKLCLALASTVTLAGCSSAPVMVAPEPSAQFERLGKAEGSSCGALLIFGSALNFLPAGLNERVENAYASALASVPGATGIIDVTMYENWYWWFVGTSRCVTIKGEAVK